MTQEVDQRIEEQEDIEGLQNSEDSPWSEYPIDTMLIRTEQRTVHDVTRRIRNGTFIMNPDFQRDFIWKEDRQSKLIESVLMRIPLPVFYLAEDPEGNTIVVDGLQRLSTFKNFVDNELVLNLPKQIDLHGKRFRDLAPKLQNRVEDSNLILYVIDAKAPERARLDIFERVNSGVPLTRQQMRNSLYNGRATRFLAEQAEKNLFKEATGGSLRTKTMRDREFVNRFCAFHLLGTAEYSDDQGIDAFLSRCLKKMNSLPEARLSEIAIALETSLANNLMVFEKHAFRKIPKTNSRNPLNACLWDVMSTGLCGYSRAIVETNAARLREAFNALLQDVDFNSAITSSVDDPKKVKRRFDMTGKMLEEVFGAYPDKSASFQML